MSQVINAHGDPLRPTPPIPTRDSVSQMQVGAILSVMHALQSYLLYNASRDPEDHPELDGGAHAAAVTTFAKACDRMDKILEDDKRWTLTDHDALYASILKTQTDIQRLNEENVTTLQQM